MTDLLAAAAGRWRVLDEIEEVPRRPLDELKFPIRGRRHRARLRAAGPHRSRPVAGAAGERVGQRYRRGTSCGAASARASICA